MRNLEKLQEPYELKEMRPYWERKVVEVGSDYYKTKYRSASIKQVLKQETGNKCIYCESKIGHNTPGDVEHKVPVSLDETKRFEWKNLTIACTECNRRKNDYYDNDTMFLDPYRNNVEQQTFHVGPVVFNQPGNDEAEITIRILELSEIEKRNELFTQKVNKLKSTNNLLARIKKCENPVLKTLLLEELEEMTDKSSEYSGMIRSLINALPTEWAN